ncbi:MAG: polyketide cyclase [Cyanobacteria bacterium RYN_339]|nr:polyketide cyclase [Cyanobacteria bacterium RYN_339]
MTPTQTPSRRLMQHIRLKAPVSRVYHALLDVDTLVKWFPDRATVDARPGGNWAFEFDTAGGGVHKASGKFLELVPNQLVRYSWSDAMDDDDRTYCNLTVTFRLVADGDETDLYLEESGYEEGALYDELFGNRTGGWGKMFAGLAETLAS